MRVIYDYGLGNSAVSHAPTGGRTGKETVLVISLRRDGNPSQGNEPSDGIVTRRESGDEVRVSDEALARSREVEAHEKSHMNLLGGVAASPIMYDTVRGPNGEALRVGGSVKVDMAEVPGDPEATLRKAQAIIAAANAPNDPSAADMRTANQAYRMASKAKERIDAERSGVDLLS